MINLWYNHDEVTGFHPIVEKVLNDALVKCGYANVAEVLHHPTIPNSSIVPDFAIKLKSSNRFIFVLEVKKTNRDCYSQRFQNQTRSYVTDLNSFWEPNFSKYFCLTNIETLTLFAEREGSVTSCLLKNYPIVHQPINATNHDATITVEGFQESIENIFYMIFKRVSPTWSDNWEPIIESFYHNYISIKEQLSYDEELVKSTTLYELFRLMAFSYLKEFYSINNDDKSAFFRGRFPTEKDELEVFKSKLENSFNRILELDFRQIFSNYPNSDVGIFPDNLSEEIMPYFKDVISKLVSYGSSAVSDNSSPEYIFNLLSSKIYDKSTMHNRGQVMSDSELSILLSTLTIEQEDSIVLDPCCGDGALLDASYEYLNRLALDNGVFKIPDELLSQNIGVEIDSFLSQLATFRLLSKNLHSINTDTTAEVETGDIFTINIDKPIDVILMNPPFIRNDNKGNSITTEAKNKMLTAIENSNIECFVTNASQPNLYYYFINYVWNFLNENGRAGLIVMAKFLNNQDGEALKSFMLDKVESIILYPNNYFQDFKVTTLIVILSKNPSKDIKFFRVFDENLLASPDSIKTILNTVNETEVTASYSLKVCDRNILDASSNWRLPLIDPEERFNALDQLTFMENINNFFEIKRGKAGNTGGSKIVYPNFEIEPYSLINSIYRGKGIQNNRVKRNLILDENDLTIEQAIHFPERYNLNIENGLSEEFTGDCGLRDLYQEENNKNEIKWEKIVNTSYQSQVLFDLLIPRADRTKHGCYYNPCPNNPTVLSTNFWYLCNVKNININHDSDIQIKFIAAYLNSSFGQIQFEIHSNNQEGMRKIEGFHIQEFKVIDLSILSDAELSNVVNKFIDLNSQGISFCGLESLESNPRRELDLGIGKIIFERDSLGFESVEKLVDYFELFLFDLVEDRGL